MADEPISFEAFSAALLEPWAQPPASDGTCITSPREAAARATYEAAVTHAKAKGTVLVTCTDAASARACLDYLRSFFSDQPQLAKLLKKTEGDGVTLHGGTKVVVTTDATRRPRDLLATIRLSPEAPSGESATAVEQHWDDPIWVARTLSMVFAEWLYHGRGYDAALKLAALLEPDDDPVQVLARMAREHEDRIANLKPMNLFRVTPMQDGPLPNARHNGFASEIRG